MELLMKPGIWSIKVCPWCESEEIDNLAKTVTLQRRIRYNHCNGCGRDFVLKRKNGKKYVESGRFN